MISLYGGILLFRLRNLKIGNKFLFAFFISIVLFIVATIIAFTQVSNAKSNVSHIDDVSQITLNLAKLSSLIEEKDAIIANYIILNSASYVDRYEEGVEETNELLKKLEPNYKGEEKEYFNHIKTNIYEMDELFLNDIMEHIDDISEVKYIRSDIKIHQSTAITIIDDLIELGENSQRDSILIANQNMEQIRDVLIAVNVISILIGTVIMLLISRSVNKHLNKVVHMTEEIAQGNLTVDHVQYKERDEIGQLTDATNRLINNILQIITKVSHAANLVRESSHHLNNATREVKVGSEQMVITMEELATGAESQSNSAQHLTENMDSFVTTINSSHQKGEEITSSTQDILILASEGSHLMETSIEQMKRIDTSVSDAVTQVKGLEQKSNNISQLVDVVKDIAEQTNLLALNAAIEAARAGEHGKGFAVVADEVRKLAEEVGSSVQEITDIVHTIQTETDDVVHSLTDGYKGVKEGIEQLDKTGESFQTINHSISSMVNNVQNISDELKVITKDSQQMNELISEIAAVSEEAAAGIEETSASSEETSSSMDVISQNAENLADLANDLNKEIAVFKTKSS